MLLPLEMSALRLALLLQRSGKNRARISEKTIKILTGRKMLRGGFIEPLKEALIELGIHLVEIERGGYGVFYSSILAGSPAITAKNFLPASERENLTIEDMYNLLGLNENEDSSEE